ncbi:MAG: AsmA family protein, partial [Lachnospiraceae bacterium]|nr:AsmA family protein [Lachnospiraceae bacterium]
MSTGDLNISSNKSLQQEPATDNRQEADSKKRKPMWRRILKITGWTIGTLIGLLLLIMCLAAWILTPERLTPLVEKYGSEYLNADVKVKRVELTIWSSFPSIRLDVTDLHLTSRTLQGQPDSVMQALGKNPERLLDAATFSASVNPWKLLSGTIALGYISANGLSLNLVSYNDKINNYMILPESGEEEAEEEEGTPRKLRFGRISLNAQGGIHYLDAASGTDVTLANASLNITPLDTDCKQLDTKLQGKLSLGMDGENYLSGWPVQCSGRIDWDLNTLDFNLPDYNVSLAIFSAKIKTALSLAEPMTLKSCSLDINPVSFKALQMAIPKELIEKIPMLRQIDTDMSIAASAEVKCPWRFDAPDLPDVAVNFNIPESYFTLNDETDNPLLSIDNIALQGNMYFNGAKPELSRLDVPLFNIAGKDMSLDMSAYVEELLSDNPLITFQSKGHLNLDPFAAFMPGSTLHGEVEADAEIKCRLDDMRALRYENIDANGSLLVRNFLCELPSMAMKVYSRLAKFSFGTALSEHGPRVPGTLSAFAEVDTLDYSMPGMRVGIVGATLKAGASDKLLRERTNDKEITPMGMLLTARNFKMDSEADTTKVRIKAMRADGSLTRYEGNAESPLMKTNLSADRLVYSDPTMRLGAKTFSSNLTAHLRERRHKGVNKGKRASSPKQENVMRLKVDEGVKNL